jgi:hypothetical protein
MLFGGKKERPVPEEYYQSLNRNKVLIRFSEKRLDHFHYLKKVWEKFKTIIAHNRGITFDLGLSKEDHTARYDSVPWMCLFIDSHPSHVNNSEVLADMLDHKVRIMTEFFVIDMCS